MDTSDENEEEMPDITGEYACLLTEISGCDDELAAWATEDLTVTGAPDDLSFEFAGGEILHGRVDSAFGLEFGGSVPPEGTAELVGVVFEEDNRWTLEGDLTVEYSGDESCTLEAVFEADEIVP